MTPSAVPLELASAETLSQDPLSRERFGPGGMSCLLLAMDGAHPTGRLAAWLRALPAPVIGVGAAEAPAAAACDTISATEAEAAPLVATTVRNPHAAAVLVQVLRATSRLDIESALTVESLAYATLQAGAEYAAWRAALPPAPPAPPEAAPLLLHRSGATLRLTLNRPGQRNAIDATLRDALSEALALAALDATITHVVVDAAGKCFSVGGDLTEFTTSPDPAAAHAIRSLRLPARGLAAVADRVHARVHGACIGAGLELAAFAHRVTASPTSFFQLPELRMGLIPGAGGCVSLPRRIGTQRTAWLALSGARLSARRALAWGLVDTLEPAP